MAVAINTVGVNTSDLGTWNGEDVINLLEQQLTWLEYHGAADSGLVVGISSVTVGENRIAGSSAIYYESKPFTTSGVGTMFRMAADRETSILDTGGYDHDGELVRFFPNNPGTGYTGGEIVSFKSSEFDLPSAPDVTVQVVVDAVVSGAVSFAVTFTSAYLASGTDRNGEVSGQGTTITIKEGDTIKLTADQFSSSYEVAIIRGDEFGVATDGTLVSASATNYVWGEMSHGTYITGNSGGTYSWTTRWGDRGQYYVRPYGASPGTYAAQTPTIIVEPADSGNISTVSYGGTDTFYSKGLNGNYSWGVWKQVIDANKEYGTTFRTFCMSNNTSSTIKCTAVPRWNPVYKPNGGSGYTVGTKTGDFGFGPSYCGNAGLDISNSNQWSDNSSPHWDITSFDDDSVGFDISTGGNTDYQLDLIVYKSGIDPNFAVFSFNAPTVSGTNFDANTFGTFSFSNYTTTVWDLDYVYLSGMQLYVGNGGDTTTPHVEIWNNFCGIQDTSQQNPSKRSAEFGYSSWNSADQVAAYTVNNYYAKTVEQTSWGLPSIYYRPGGTDERGAALFGSGPHGYLDAASDFNAVIKGLPLSATFMPCPYYIPDDFVIIQFKYNQTNANIQQGDTITISGSEVYKIIEASYDQASTTSGIAFCARIV